MKKLILLSFLLFNLASISCQTLLTAKVVGVKDGDTVVVLDDQNNQVTLRLAEVDCPEKSQPFGTRAKQFTSDQVYMKTIKYSVYDTDRYGRIVAKVFYDNKYLSAEIIKAGMGWHYKKYSTSTELAKFETAARKNRVGLWVDKNPIEPSIWRKR
jgi:micrococcal nuclease